MHNENYIIYIYVGWPVLIEIVCTGVGNNQGNYIQYGMLVCNNM